jgi:hypothetical protein
LYLPVRADTIFYHLKTKSIPTYTHRDSIIVHDSVTLWKSGDTVYKEKYQIMYKDRWYDRHHTDTVIRRDSIRVPYPVERSLTRWERWRMKLGGYAGIAILIVIVLSVIR